jgi:hypothetical protein
MNNLELRIEWENAPGVKDIVLASTWARLEIWINGACATRVLDRRSRSERDGVYGSLFPLAEWIIENWWFLLHEAPRARQLSARRTVLAGTHRWMQRHNLLTARDGGALPDLTIMRDGESVTLAWFEDPSTTDDRPVRFLTTGHVELAPNELQSNLSDFVNRVLERLGKAGDSETDRVRANWQELARSAEEERVLCERAARLGLDPYDADDLPDSRLALLEESLSKLPESVIDDFLDAAKATDAEVAFQRIMAGTSVIDKHAGQPMALTGLSEKFQVEATGAHPYEAGYRLARKFRETLGLGAEDPIPQLENIVASRLGWEPSIQCFDLADRHIKGLVGLSKSGVPHVLATKTTSVGSRFLQGRALYDLISGRCSTGPRLLTSAPVKAQAPGRAFAAELLAPSSALKARVQGTLVEDEELDALAQEFNVSEQVIRHQLENHRIAMLA